MTLSGAIKERKSTPARVLVVDDEEDVRNLVAFNLRAAGLEVLLAGSGTEAIERVRVEQPDLVILDLMLPEMDGVSVCEMIRKLPRAAATPVVMLTAWATDRARVIGLEAGANDYITKPFSPRDLVRRVRALLAANSFRDQMGKGTGFKKVVIDLEAGRVTVDDHEIELAADAFRTLSRVLEALLKRLDPTSPPTGSS